MRHKTGTLIWWGGLIGLVIVVALVAFLNPGSPSQASSGASPSTQSKDPRIATLTKGTTFLLDIPKTLPANGMRPPHNIMGKDGQ